MKQHLNALFLIVPLLCSLGLCCTGVAQDAESSGDAAGLTSSQTDSRLLQEDNSAIKAGNTNRAVADSWLPVRRPKVDIEVNTNGATASSHGQAYHTVDFDGNLNHAESIMVNLPQNLKIQGHVTAVSVIDAKGKRTFVGLLKNCAGEISVDTAREVVYRDAFEGIKADVVYRYGQTYFEQFVVFRSQFDLPAGMDEETAQVEVWSEFFNTPTPRKQLKNIAIRNSKLRMVTMEDETLDFAWMKMSEGRAFMASSDGSGESLLVAKTWFEADGGRKFLIETADYLSLKSMLGQLPRTASITPKTEFMMAQNGRTVPKLASGKRLAKPMQYASSTDSLREKPQLGAQRLALASPGVAMDFILVNSALINIDFGTSATTKRGPAVVGKTDNDFWNSYGASDGLTKSLYLSDGSTYAVTMFNNFGQVTNATVTNGVFPVSCGEPMFDTYMTFSSTLYFTNLPSGVYNMYLYGHGPATNKNVYFMAAGAGGPSTVTGIGDFWSSFTGWVKGAHYIVANRTRTPTSNFSISTWIGWGGSFPTYSTLINGAQIVAATNLQPYVEAGPDMLIPYGATATLNGVADDDGMPVGSTVSVNWSKVAGPGVVSFFSTNSSTTTATFSLPGSYILRLRANDSVMTNEDTITVTVIGPQAQVWDLKTNWSDSYNPNGVWTYREGTNALPHVNAWTSSQNSFSPNSQAGWAKTENSNTFLPCWFKSSVGTTFVKDWQIGDVVVHSTDPGNGYGNGVANVVWTSPISGYVTIVGGVWLGRDINRANNWELYFKNNQISSGYVHAGDGYSRTNPCSFSSGSGGPNALVRLPVSVGDKIQLNIVKDSSRDADFAGVNLTIVQVYFDGTWNLKTDWSDSANPNGVWSYREGANALPHTDGWCSNQVAYVGLQPAWAYNGANNFLPSWFKSSTATYFAKDFQIGDVVGHALDPANGGGHAQGRIVWTSPINGNVNISGAAWLGRTSLGRSDQWILYHGSTQMRSGTIYSSDAYNRSNPFYFLNGSGTASLENVPVTVGDTIAVQIQPTPGYTAEFMGLDLTITKVSENLDLDGDGLNDDTALKVRITRPTDQSTLR